MSQTVKPGYKQTEVGVIPEEWEVKPFTQVTDLITCGIAATPDYVSESQGYPFLSSTNVKEGRVVWSGYKHISAALHRQLYRNNPPRRGDILYSRVGTFGEAGVVDVDFEFSVYVSLTLIKPGKALDSCYLMQLLNSNAYKQRAKDHIYLGGGVGNLNVDIVRRYPIVVPPLPEQRAIATALSDVDALLAALDRLIAKQRDLKQAAMQQLLTGQTRLPGFTGKWETKRLGELGATYGGLTGKTKADFGDGSAHYITFMNVMTNIVIDCGEFERVKVALTESQNRVTKGDLLFNGSSETPEEVAMCAVMMGDVPDLFLNSFCFGFRFRERAEADGLFLAYYLRSKEGRELMKSLAQGSTRYNLSKVALLKSPLLLPPLPEQTAIATVLSDMDLELAALEQRRNKTRALKQGMMQELLTGRTRLV